MTKLIALTLLAISTFAGDTIPHDRLIIRKRTIENLSVGEKSCISNAWWASEEGHVWIKVTEYIADPNKCDLTYDALVTRASTGFAVTVKAPVLTYGRDSSFAGDSRVVKAVFVSVI